MSQIMVSTDFSVSLNRDNVLAQIGCFEDSPIFEEVLDEYHDLEATVLGLAQPKAVVAFGHAEKEFAPKIQSEDGRILYAITTVGKELSTLSDSYFKKGDYLKGMLSDAMADGCLFSMEDELIPLIKKICQEEGVGIMHRYEAPHDIPMISQKYAYEATMAHEKIGLNITSGYMLDPVKSNCLVFGVSKDKSLFQLEHDCSKCERYDCPMRKVPEV